MSCLFASCVCVGERDVPIDAIPRAIPSGTHRLPSYGNGKTFGDTPCVAH